MAEVLRQLGGMNHQQGFVVDVSGRGAPVERAGDHCFAIDHGELMMHILEMGLSACVLRDAHAS